MKPRLTDFWKKLEREKISKILAIKCSFDYNVVTDLLICILRLMPEIAYFYGATSVHVVHFDCITVYMTIIQAIFIFIALAILNSVRLVRRVTDGIRF